MKLDFTTEELSRILTEASETSKKEATEYFNTRLKGIDQFACGFAWVEIYGIRGNSKLGKQLESLGIKKDSYKKCHSVWDPSGLNIQNIDTKEVGAQAYAKVLQKYGFNAYDGSRLD